MKLNTEKAFDMLPYVAYMFEKLDIKKFIESNKVNGTGKTEEQLSSLQRELGTKIIMYLVKNCGKVKEEFFTVVAIASGKEIEAVKEQSITETVKIFKDIAQDNELFDFFREAMQ